MSQAQGTIALIGSGELSGTMVETHKKLLADAKSGDLALFLDTPAGFQENVDLISRRAVDYFESQVLQEMKVATFKSAEAARSGQAGEVFSFLGRAAYVLIGPGSPTYIVRQLEGTPVPALLGAMINRGGCLVAASAAALSVGSYTLPVYEIYKVGEPIHWVPGLNILGNLGLDLVVIPHWNNAEGGNHDTRYCYMGEKRFTALEGMLPPGTKILGIDEHTVCILDFATGEALVNGLGRVIIRQNRLESSYSRGEKFTLGMLKDGLTVSRQSTGSAGRESGIGSSQISGVDEGTIIEPAFWERMHAIEDAFQSALKEKNTMAMITQILESDHLLWQAQLDLENPEFISQGRERFREMIVLAGTAIKEPATIIPDILYSVVRDLVSLREEYRAAKSWQQADRIRSILQDAGIMLEDAERGPKWQI